VNAAGPEDWISRAPSTPNIGDGKQRPIFALVIRNIAPRGPQNQN
jgi:hypothetical protein